MLIFRVDGVGAGEAFRLEPGGHRWQRIPDNDKRGRVHTSTVTVAVMREPSEAEVQLNERDLDWKACRGSGAGGQNRNKVASAIQLTHLPTGMMIRCESERSQHQNRRNALGLLRVRLLERERSSVSLHENAARRSQVGSGMRGDKVRTIRVQDGIVTHHSTGKRVSLRDYLRGALEGLR